MGPLAYSDLEYIGIPDDLRRRRNAGGSLSIIAMLGQSNNGFGPSQETSLLTTVLPTTYNTGYTPVTLAQIGASSNTDPIPFLGPYTTQAMASYVGANGSDQFGPEQGMSRYLTYSRSSPAWAIAKFAVASSSLAQWLPTSTYPTSPSSGPNLFSQAVSFWQAQETALGGRIVAFCSASGETDAGDPTLSANYNSNQSAILAGLRAHWPSAPFIIYELGTSTAQTYTSTVRTQEASFISGNANVYMFNVDDLAMVGGTGVHFTADSLVILGQRFAKQILSVLSLDARPRALFSIAPSGSSVSFTDASIDDDGTIASWAWTFGDGGTSTLQNPSHTYSGGGPFTASLVATDNNGLASAVTTRTIFPGWTVDSGNGVGYPANSTEWTAVVGAVSGVVTPNDLYLCQDTTGNAADAIGSNAGVVGGAASWTYRDTFGAATRKALTVADNSSTARFLYNSSPSASTNSIAFMVDVLIPTAPAAERSIASYGGLDLRITTAGFLKGVNASNIIVGSQSIAGTRTRIVVIHDITNSRHIIFTPTQRIVVPWATSTATFFSWGKGGDNSCNCKYGYVALWTGTGAEMTDVAVKNLLIALGENVTL